MSDYAKYVEKHRELILSSLDYIWKNPETGYKEWKTHAYMEEQFAKLGYELTLAGDIPGFVAEIDTGKEGPTVAVFGEMDALICGTHPEADPETNAVHSCGHCAQAAALIGLAAALKEDGALDGMCGKIKLVAVPAEELLEIGYRESLRKKGIIKYFGGKPEFMWRGLLDGVDMAFMIHTGEESKSGFNINLGSNGCIVKTMNFKGVSAHAGGSPHKGVNALYAANLALNAANALRETFIDNSHIRFHPIITNGGDAVNAIPETVTVESYVRGATMEDIVTVNKKINRAMAASAAAIGAKLHLRDIPGYWPRNYPDDFRKAFIDAAEQVIPGVKVYDSWSTGCSDMGDIGTVMPAIHPNVSGAQGTGHGNNYYIVDGETACVKSAEAQLVLLSVLLSDNAKRAKEIIANYKPQFASMQEYFDYVDKLNIDSDVVEYDGDEKVILKY